MAEYPVFLALGYLIVVSYVARTLFVSVRLPGAVGVLMAGWAWSTFAQQDLLAARDELQELAFFLVLLICGFHISLKDLTLPLLVMSVVPVAFELAGICLFAVFVLNLTVVQGMLAATCFCAVGDGLVIPKMREMAAAHPGHPLPRMVFAWVPLEDTLALTLFGVLAGFAKAEADAEVAIWRTVLANVLRLVITVVLGWGIGRLSAVLIPQRSKVSLFGRPMFSGATVEAFLLIFGVALSSFGLGMAKNHRGDPFVPMGLAPGALVQPELLVIVLGIAFGDRVAPELLHDVEGTLGGVWVFGQLFLFGMLGSKTSLEPFRDSWDQVLPCMAVGFLFRAAGILVGLWTTRGKRCPALASTESREACLQANQRSLLFDTAFCFLAMLPRASIQGALAGEPARRGFFSDAGEQGLQATALIANGGRVYIFACAIVGSILLDLLGPRLLRASMATAQLPEAVVDEERRMLEEGWKAQVRSWKSRTGLQWQDRLNQFEGLVRAASGELDIESLKPVDGFRRAATAGILDGKLGPAEGLRKALSGPFLISGGCSKVSEHSTEEGSMQGSSIVQN